MAALTATVGALLHDRLYYGNDDLLQFDAAREHGLSWATLSLNVFQHFAPYNRLTHTAVYAFSDLSPLLGLAFVLTNLALLLAAALWLMTELRVSTPRRVVGLVWMALVVPVTETAVWFDSAIHILPAIAVTLAVCAAHVRGIRTGRNRWHAVAVLLFLLGQATQERPALALPLVVLVDVLVLWRGQPWRTRVLRLWRLRWPLVALTAAGVLVGVALRLFVVVETFQAPGWLVTLRTMLSGLSNYALPSLVNQPLGVPAGTGVEIAVAITAVLVGVVVARLRRGNGDLLLFVAATFLLYYGFLKFSPLLTAQSVTANAERLNYALYVVVPGIVALVLLRGPRRGRAPVRTVRHRVRSRAAGVTALLGLAAYLVWSNDAYLDRQWEAGAQARAWLDQVRDAGDEWTDPDVTVVPLRAHPAMTTGWARSLGREDWLLGLVREDYRPAGGGSRTVLIDSTGALRPAALQELRPDVRILSGECGTGTTRTVDNSDLYADPVRGGPLFVRLDYRATEDLDVRLSAGWEQDWAPNALPSLLPAGRNTVLLPVESGRLDLVDVDVLGEGRFCVEEASVVRPVLELAGGERCRFVDVHGRPGLETECP